MNGRGPLVHDNSDFAVVLRGRDPEINVTMENVVWSPDYWESPNTESSGTTIELLEHLGID